MPDLRSRSPATFWLVVHWSLPSRASFSFTGRPSTSYERHDLDRGLDAACELGLGDLVDIEDRDRAVISDVNRYYVSKDLEYVKTGYKSYPDPQVMLTTVRCLLDGISPAVCRWLPHD